MLTGIDAAQRFEPSHAAEEASYLALELYDLAIQSVLANIRWGSLVEAGRLLMEESKWLLEKALDLGAACAFSRIHMLTICVGRASQGQRLPLQKSTGTLGLFQSCMERDFLQTDGYFTVGRANKPAK